MNDIDEYIKMVTQTRHDADQLHDDNAGALMEKIAILANCYMAIGRVSSMLDGEYKRIYAGRKYEQARAHIAASKNKAETAEVAVHHLRLEEAQAYEDMMRWRNALLSTREELHVLKMRMRVDYGESSTEAPL
jgi:hypothetical protein